MKKCTLEKELLFRLCVLTQGSRVMETALQAMKQLLVLMLFP